MPKFKVVRVAYDEVIVEADDEREAEEIACNMDGDEFRQVDTQWQVYEECSDG